MLQAIFSYIRVWKVSGGRIRIDMRVRGEGWFFDAAYIFLGEKEVYVTDALYIIRIDELDTKSLNRIYQKIILK